MSLKSNDQLIRVENLRVVLSTEEGNLSIIEDISFEIKKSEIFALVGESGCGKSITAVSLTRLLPFNQASYPSGIVTFEETDLLSCSMEDLRKIRGREVAYIFQEPFSSLNPLQKIGDQLIEGYLHHKMGDKVSAIAKAETLLKRVGITDAKQRLDQFPNQFSGGMLQRVSIAMALMCDPKLLIADEPTSAIDVTIQLQLIELLLELKKEIQMSILFISHDIGLVSHLADRIGVMYAGKLVEIGTTTEVIDSPKHPYAKALIEAYPTKEKLGKRLQIIEGIVPNPKDYPRGCHFYDRCKERAEICKESEPIFKKLSDTHTIQCFVAG